MKMFLLLMLLSPVTFGASNQHIAPSPCENEVKWATQIFDLVTENADVILNAVDPDDQGRLNFIKQWVQDKKSMEDLSKRIWSFCPDSV